MEERAYLNHFLRITGCPEAASVETLDMLHTRVVNAMERHPFIEVGHDGVMAFMAMRAFKLASDMGVTGGSRAVGTIGHTQVIFNPCIGCDATQLGFRVFNADDAQR